MKINKYISLIGICIAAFLGAFTYFEMVQPASANPLAFASACQTASATTSLSFMTAGNATTTITCKLNGNVQAATDATLNMWFAASSSPLSNLGVRFLWSKDGQSYYSDTAYDNGAASLGNSATTTKILGPADYTYNQVATTTDPITGLTAATSSITMQIPNPQRAHFMQAVFFLRTSSSPAAIWAEIVPKAQTP